MLRQLTLDISFGREWLDLKGYGGLDRPWRPTSAIWTATTVRAGLAAWF